MNLLLELKGKNYNVDVLAHSQGNVVVAEALREAKDGGLTPPLMNAYVATQAAISSSLFDSSAVDYFTTQNRNWTHATPLDALAHFPLTNSPFDGSAQPYMAGTANYATHRMNFYNEGDYAVGDNTSVWFASARQSAWEANNTNERPGQGLRLEAWEIPDAFGYDGTPPAHFYERSTDTSGQQQTRPLDPAVADDRFKILAFAAQSYGRALGAGPLSDASQPTSYFSPNIDLAAAPTFFGQGHYEHDAQFMYDIQQRWHYWDKLLEGLNIPYKPWSTP
jgi:hypothetical protein